MCSCFSCGAVWLSCVSAGCGLFRLLGIVWLCFRVGLVGRLRIIVTVYFSFSVMAADWNSRAADDQYCMRTSWDPSGVVVLDTTVIPDVVGLHAFDAPVVMPDKFSMSRSWNPWGSMWILGTKTRTVFPKHREHCPGLGSRCSRGTPWVSRPPLGEFVRHKGVSCPTCVHRDLTELKRCCPVTLGIFTWLRVSYGGALFHGAMYVREPPRTVLTT